VKIFKEIDDYLDSQSSSSFRSTSKSINRGIQKGNQPEQIFSSSSPYFRIDPTYIMNRLRGIATERIAPQPIPTIDEDVEAERPRTIVRVFPQEDQSGSLQSSIMFGLIVFFFFGFIYILMRRE
jgi:hypothetical protein